MRGAYHRFDIRMGYGVELVILEFELRTDIDVGTFVFGAVTVLWCREDCQMCEHKYCC